MINTIEQKRSKLHHNEKLHNTTTIVVNSFILVTCVALIALFWYKNYGYITYLLPSFFIIFSAIKISKGITMHKKLTILNINSEVTDLNFYIYLQWTRKKIGNFYFSIFIFTLLLIFYAIYNSLLFTIGGSIANPNTYSGFSILWATFTMFFLLMWNFNTVWLNNLLKNYETFISYRKGVKLEIDSHILQSKKDYWEIISIIIGFLTIIWGIYLLIKRLLK